MEAFQLTNSKEMIEFKYHGLAIPRESVDLDTEPQRVLTPQKQTTGH